LDLAAQAPFWPTVTAKYWAGVAPTLRGVCSSLDATKKTEPKPRRVFFPAIVASMVPLLIRKAPLQRGGEEGVVMHLLQVPSRALPGRHPCAFGLLEHPCKQLGLL
jgi:hypothetical protein